MRGPSAAVFPLFTAVAGLIVVTAVSSTAAQSRVNVPAPSAVKPIVPVPPRNPGYPGTLSIHPSGSIGCRRICIKFSHGTATHPAVCGRWRIVC